MHRSATRLTPTEHQTLEACSHHAPHPPQRRRALAVLAHHRAQSLPQLARFFAVAYQTAHGWLQAWERQGIAGLAEGPRSGRPPKLDPATQKK